MNKQEAFDIVARHLLTQRQPSLNSIGECSYRGENGLKCAIGALIPDALYDHRCETATIASASCHRFDKRYPHEMRLGEILEAINIDLTDKSMECLLQALQDCHDVSEPSEWREELSRIAKRHGLEFKE